jgi:hypothetical protein
MKGQMDGDEFIRLLRLFIAARHGTHVPQSSGQRMAARHGIGPGMEIRV